MALTTTLYVSIHYKYIVVLFLEGHLQYIYRFSGEIFMSSIQNAECKITNASH